MRCSKALSGIWRVRIRSEMSAWGHAGRTGRSEAHALGWFSSAKAPLVCSWGAPADPRPPPSPLPASAALSRLDLDSDSRGDARLGPSPRRRCGPSADRTPLPVTGVRGRRGRGGWGQRGALGRIPAVSTPERPYLTRDTSQPWLALALRPPASETRRPLLLQPLTPGAPRLGLCNLSSWERRVPEASAVSDSDRGGSMS